MKSEYEIVETKQFAKNVLNEITKKIIFEKAVEILLEED
jgi:hypothetical protein